MTGRSEWCEVIAFDPGGVTGWSVICIKPKDLISDKPFKRSLFQHFAHGQILGSEMTQTDQVVELVDVWPQAAVVTEAFVQRIKNTGLETDVAYSPVRINSVLKWWLATEDRFMFRQQPSQAKSAWDNERLAAAKMEPEGGHAARHSKDGVRHGLTFLSRARQQKGLRHTAWPKHFNENGEWIK